MAEGFITADRLTRFVEDKSEEPANDGDSDLSPARSRARVRARTISIKRLSKRELERGTMRYPASEHAKYERPITRADCLPGGSNAQRPCPWVSCAAHLYLDVSTRTGSIKMNYPDREPWELEETCSLDVADRGGITLEEVGAALSITRERARQLEVRGLAKLLAVADEEFMDEFIREDPQPWTTRQNKTRTHVDVVVFEGNVVTMPGVVK